jgi:hypothetical protein
LPSCYWVDRVILASNIDDNSADAFAAQLSLPGFNGPPANQAGYRTDYRAGREERDGSNDQPHSRPHDAGAKRRAELLSNC